MAFSLFLFLDTIANQPITDWIMDHGITADTRSIHEIYSRMSDLQVREITVFDESWCHG